MFLLYSNVRVGKRAARATAPPKHALALEEFGHQEVANAWVLLDEEDGAAAE